MDNWIGSRITEGLPRPLGATGDGLGVNFALFSAHATKTELCLFDPAGERELERIELPEYTDEVNAAGIEMEEEQWSDGHMRCFGMLMDGRAQASGIKRPASDATLLLCLNAHHDVVDLTLPPFVGGTRWLRLIDTNDEDRADLPSFCSGDKYEATGRSLLLLAGLTRGDAGRAVAPDRDRPVPRRCVRHARVRAGNRSGQGGPCRRGRERSTIGRSRSLDHPV